MNPMNNVFEMLSILRRRMVGQHEAIRTVAFTISIASTRKRSMHRPLASLLFAGPPCVGKQTLAWDVAEAVFGDRSCSSPR
ncbi:MAG: hypothetical protein JXP34_14255 [Planctomycetes bacterium]|nr:hypothetical protein [Planctomycetota bacterium]